MNEFFTVVLAVLPVFGIMGVGFGLRRMNVLTAGADQSLMRITINLLLPSLIFDSVLGNAALQEPVNLLLPPVLGFGMVLAGFAVARCFCRLARPETAPEKRTFIFMAGLQNYSYLTIPLCLSLFGAGTMGVLFVHNVGTEMALWTAGIATLQGGGMAGGWKKILNAPVSALLLAVGLNFAGDYFPLHGAAADVAKMMLMMIHWFGQSAIPLALLLIGAIIEDHFEEARGGRAVSVVVAAALARLLVMPLLFLVVARFLPCSTDLKRVLVLQGAMPSAVLSVVLSKHYRGDPRTAVQVALGTSLMGLVTIPFWIRLGEHFVLSPLKN